MLYGNFWFNEKKSKVEFASESVPLTSGYSLSGRGMELSDLTIFDGRIFTVDDRYEPHLLFFIY